MMSSDTSLPPSQPEEGICTFFLHLPFEIRRQIYLDVLQDHPKLERELPGYPARQTPKHITAPISLPYATTSRRRNPRPLPSSRPLGYIPSSLLRACRQIYHEARVVPFEENEFVFAEWMTSATSYCDADTRGMAEWQRASLRHARFAMGLHELHDSPVNERGHRPALHSRLDGVLTRLPGVRTLRVNLTSGMFPTPWFERVGDGLREMVLVKEDWTGGRKWIVEGLRRMPALRVVEVECSFLAWMMPSWVSPEEKRRCEDELAVAWCARVEDILNEGREDAVRTRVVAVAKPREDATVVRGVCRPHAVADSLTRLLMPSALAVGYV